MKNTQEMLKQTIINTLRGFREGPTTVESINIDDLPAGKWLLRRTRYGFQPCVRIGDDFYSNTHAV